jgi:hypothetical protein
MCYMSFDPFVALTLSGSVLYKVELMPMIKLFCEVSDYFFELNYLGA